MHSVSVVWGTQLFIKPYRIQTSTCFVSNKDWGQTVAFITRRDYCVQMQCVFQVRLNHDRNVHRGRHYVSQRRIFPSRNPRFFLRSTNPIDRRPKINLDLYTRLSLRLTRTHAHKHCPFVRRRDWISHHKQHRHTQQGKFRLAYVK
jgi:hypothetical protein